MKDKETNTSVEIKAIFEDAIDAVKIRPSKRKVSFGKKEEVAYMNLNLVPNKGKLPDRKKLPI
eukprot:9750674-Karenia_brevis.AAC.1